MRLLKQLEAFDTAEVIVSDGGSTDGGRSVLDTTPNITIIDAPKGRGQQIKAGADAASGDILWFLHADTQLPHGAIQALRNTFSKFAHPKNL